MILKGNVHATDFSLMNNIYLTYILYRLPRAQTTLKPAQITQVRILFKQKKKFTTKQKNYRNYMHLYMRIPV